MSNDVLTGTLCFHSETGFEAAPWALYQDTPANWLDFLRPGDTLKVVAANEQVIYDGMLLIGEGRGGFGDTYWYPKGIRKNRWLSLFLGEKRATLKRGVPDSIADLVAKVMTWHNYLLHIESYNAPLSNCIEVHVACYFPDERRKPTRLKLWFDGGVLKDVRPI